MGLALIIKGSDWFVEAAVWFAKAWNISPIVIGATLVSFCTTLPEILVSTGSAIRGNTGLAFGNAAGSVAFNTGIIYALVILCVAPPLLHPVTLKIKTLSVSLLLLTAGVVAYVFGEITRTLGIILFCFTFVYLAFNYIQSKRELPANKEEEKVKISRRIVLKNLGLFLLGLGMTLGGAFFMIENSISIAGYFNVPEMIIGVTMAAVGTSLPELVTAITSIRKKVASLSIGNILGANMINLTMVLGLSAMIQPIRADQSMIFFHIPVTLLITLSLTAGTWFSGRKYSRITGAILMAIYLVYLVANVIVAT